MLVMLQFNLSHRGFDQINTSSKELVVFICLSKGKCSCVQKEMIPVQHSADALDTLADDDWLD